MGVEENRKVVQLAYEAFLRGEMKVLFDSLADDIVWTNYSYPDSPISGVFYGKSGVQQFFAALGGQSDIQKFDITHYLAAEDKVVVLVDYKATIKATGKTSEQYLVHVMTVKDGKIATWDEYEDAAGHDNPWL